MLTDLQINTHAYQWWIPMCITLDLLLDKPLARCDQKPGAVFPNDFIESPRLCCHIILGAAKRGVWRGKGNS